MRALTFAVFLTVYGASSGLAGADVAASFLCESQDNGHPAPASFRLLSGQQEIASGRCGVPQAIPPGLYQALTVLEGALDRPTRRERVQLEAGQTRKLSVQYETGELVVEVRRMGQRSVGTVHVFFAGKPLASVAAGSAIRLSTGSYGVAVESQGEKRPPEAVTIVRDERRVLVSDFAEAAGKSSQ